TEARARSEELLREQAQVQNLQAEKKDLQQQAEELSTEAKARSEELLREQAQVQNLQAEKKDLQQQTEELSTEVKARSEELLREQAQVQNLQTEKKDLLSKKENEVADMQQTLRINNKLMLKSGADLKDLQNQYRVMMQQQDKQNTLLCELKEKLCQASEYYTQLNLQNLVPDDNLLEPVGDSLEEKEGKGAKG
ncbi:MAG: hypothetical protein L3J24_10380, partial [Xanthomonadales bacterium]|nr:hypothetical protein [Xanthomonadales bacterium]